MAFYGVLSIFMVLGSFASMWTRSGTVIMILDICPILFRRISGLIENFENSARCERGHRATVPDGLIFASKGGGVLRPRFCPSCIVVIQDSYNSHIVLILYSH